MVALDCISVSVVVCCPDDHHWLTVLAGPPVPSFWPMISSVPNALLVDEAVRFVFGVYLTNHNTAKAVADVGKLAAAGDPFLIASSSPHRLATALKWRNACDATLDASVSRACLSV